MRGLGLAATVAAAAVLAGSLSGCTRTPDPAAGDAWVRLAAVEGRPAAGYFTIHGGEAPVRIVGARATGVERVELHESRMTQAGTMTMDALAGVDVPARADVVFAPGGRHLMLFGLPESARAGGTLPISLRFADGRATTMDARIVGAGEAAP